METQEAENSGWRDLLPFYALKAGWELCCWMRPNRGGCSYAHEHILGTTKYVDKKNRIEVTLI